jgi:hypothetical protein
MKKTTIPRLGTQAVDEAHLARKLDGLKRDIIKFARKHHLWTDSHFHVPFIHQTDQPKRGEVLLLTSEGPLFRIFEGGMDIPGLEEGFDRILAKYGFWGELENHFTMVFTPRDEADSDGYLKFHRWQWIKYLQGRRLTDIRAEAFEHFAKHPEELQRLGWRQFEELLDSIFKNQGFRTELGPGRNDGGVDLRLYQSEVIPELVTLVQAKRYKDPIQLEAVAALFGHAVAQEAGSALFATTSRFQPAAKTFAKSVERLVNAPALRLADGGQVAQWCGAIANDLNDFFSSGSQNRPPPPIISAWAGQRSDLVGKIVVSHGGYNIVANDFAVMEADFPHEVILRRIGSRDVSGDLQVGTEVPDPSKSLQSTEFKDARFVAFKRAPSETRKQVSLWGNRQLWSLWDGTPQHYNYMD